MSACDEDGREWLTWKQAADLVGCPVPTIDWNKRQGRIRYRPHRGARATLERESVEEFAAWYQQRAQERDSRKGRPRAGRRETGRGWQPPEPTGWVPTTVAAAVLGLSGQEVTWLIGKGRLRAEKNNGRWWVLETSVEAYRVEELRWISQAAAAEIIGCSTSLVNRHAQCGDIVRREAEGRRTPSIERDSAEQFATAWRAEKADRERRRTQREQDAPGPPRDQHVWLSAKTTALMLGISTVRVGQLAEQDRLPFTPRSGRRWFRRDHIEQVAAARIHLRRRAVGAPAP